MDSTYHIDIYMYNAYFKLLTCIIILDAGGCRVMIGLLENVMPVSSTLNLVPTHSYTPIFMPSLKHFELLHPKQWQKNFSTQTIAKEKII